MSDDKPTVLSHYDNVTLAQEIFGKHEILFQTIVDVAGNSDLKTYKIQQIKGLAGIGQMLAFEWESHFDGFADDLKKYLPGGMK